MKWEKRGISVYSVKKMLPATFPKTFSSYDNVTIIY